MTAANQTRRIVMCRAWTSKRSDATRAFADCLRDAWRWVKRMAAEAARFMALATNGGGHVRLSRSLIKSPLGRTLGHGSRADWNAAYTTAVIGR